MQIPKETVGAATLKPEETEAVADGMPEEENK
jgi:hypothetical protein